MSQKKQKAGQNQVNHQKNIEKKSLIKNANKG